MEKSIQNDSKKRTLGATRIRKNQKTSKEPQRLKRPTPIFIFFTCTLQHSWTCDTNAMGDMIINANAYSRMNDNSNEYDEMNKGIKLDEDIVQKN